MSKRRLYQGTYKDESLGADPANEPDATPTPPVNAEEETFKDRYANLRRLLQTKEDGWKTERESFQRQVEGLTRQAFKLPKDDTELKQFYNEFPDGAAFIETIATIKAKELFSEYDSKINELEEAKHMTAKEKAYAQLMKFHPDFEEIRREQAFQDWVQEQPKYIQDALWENETDAKAASRAIDLYKADLSATKKATEKPTRPAPSAAEAVTRSTRSDTPADRTDGKKMWRESEIAAFKGRFTDEVEAEIMNAAREGRVIYDVSSAR